MVCENGHKMEKKQLEKEMIKLNKEEEDLIAAVNEQVDLYGFDYDNVPMWISNWGKKGGGLIKPFMKYPYKYAKLVTNLATGAFDRTLPFNERAAKLMTLSTLMAIALAAMDDGEDKRKTPAGTDKTPSALNPRGRMYVGTVDGEEVFVRTAKYPFFNIASIAKSAAKGDWEEANNVIVDQLGSVGVLAKTGLIALGYKNKYEQYVSDESLYGKQVASFIPGFRTLNDIGNYLDSVPRNQKTFIQGIMSSLPVIGDEETLTKYRGDARSVKIPIEPEERTINESETVERPLTRNKVDILLGALAGIYVTRINPKEAQAQALREKRNDVEAEVRALLKVGKEYEAEKLAKSVGMTIPNGTYRYYERKRYEEE